VKNEILRRIKERHDEQRDRQEGTQTAFHLKLPDDDYDASD
jgi:hypothetical protein